MENYKKSRVVKLLRFLSPDVAPLIQGIAWHMIEMANRPTEVAWGIGDTLVLGGPPFANVIGSPDFGYRPMGLCWDQRVMFTQRFIGRRVKSWARFIMARTPNEVNIDTEFKYVFVFPEYDWELWKDWVADHVTEDAQIVVAQKVSKMSDIEDIIYLRRAGKKTCKLADKEEAEVGVFMTGCRALFNVKMEKK